MAPAAFALQNLGKIGRFINGAMAVKDILFDVGKLSKDVFNALSDRWIEMQDIAFQTGRSMAMSREMAMRYDRQLMQTTKELARQYGITAKEIAEFQKTYAESVGRNIVLTQEQTKAMAAMQKIAGEHAGTLIDEFDKVGVGISRATAYTGRLQERAKALGVSPAKATKMMADNIKLAASYSFRNGLNDIEKMSLKAASMRMDMQSVMAASEKFADIEGAISTSANIQVLGGSFAREFSNPMSVMYESMADPQAFQERILRTIEGKGTYDSKTGAVTFDPVTMRMMREMANQLGMSAQELNTAAMATVQNNKVEEELRASGKWDYFSQAEREAIKNLSRTNVDEATGKHQITYMDVNGETVTKPIEELTKEQLQIAQDRQMSEEGLFSDVQDIKDILERTLGRARGTTSTKENITGFKEEINSFIAQLQNFYMTTASGLLNGENFRPWDYIKTLSWPFGQIDVGSHANEGISWDDYKPWNWFGTGQYAFNEGGIVKPLQHASLGAIIQGDSKFGDKTPVMANAGEMVLNQREQKGLFDLLKDIAATGLLAYGGNKLGSKMGMKGIGTNMAINNLFSGMNLGVGGMLGIGGGMLTARHIMRGIAPVGMGINPMFGRALTLMNPTVMMNGQTIMNGDIEDGSLVEQLEDISDAIGDTTKATKSFSSRLGSLARKNTLLGNASKMYLGARTRRRAFGRSLSNSKIAHKTRNALFNLNEARHYYGGKIADTRFGKGWKNFFGDLKSLFGKSSISKVASKNVQTVVNAGTKASEAVKATTKAVGNSGKLLSGVGKVGKIFGKGIPVLGNALAIGGAISSMSSASSQYDARIDEIENSGLTDLQKARAKDRATKKKNESYGSSVGSVAGTAIGGALGSAFGPLGTIAGMWLGEKAGSFIGKGVGSLFGGSEEKKLKEHEERRLGIDETSIKNREDIVKYVKSIDSKIGINKKIGISPLSLPNISPIGDMVTSIANAIPTIGEFIKVKPSNKESVQNSIQPLGKTDINLNVSGTIKLEGDGKSSSIDISKLLDTPEFKRQLADIITRRLNENSNAGKPMLESEWTNTSRIWNKS